MLQGSPFMTIVSNGIHVSSLSMGRLVRALISAANPEQWLMWGSWRLSFPPPRSQDRERDFGGHFVRVIYILYDMCSWELLIIIIFRPNHDGREARKKSRGEKEKRQGGAKPSFIVMAFSLEAQNSSLSSVMVRPLLVPVLIYSPICIIQLWTSEEDKMTLKLWVEPVFSQICARTQFRKEEREKTS